MKTKIQVHPRLRFYFKCFLFTAVLTGALLVLLALILYRFHLSEGTLSVCITAIYVITTFFVGFLSGKREGSRKFLWGLLAGVIYFLILLVISLCLKSADGFSSTHGLIVFALCAGGGMLGGMLS